VLALTVREPPFFGTTVPLQTEHNTGMMMHVVDGMDGINDRFLANELAPDPDQSAAYNAGFSQGYMGIPFQGHHTEQFILGYINGSQGIQKQDRSCRLYGYAISLG
jgi:hypothetical protein